MVLPEIREKPHRVVDDIVQMELDLLEPRADLIHLPLRLVDIVKRDPPDGDPEETFHVLIGHLPFDQMMVRDEAVDDRLRDRLLGLHLLDLFIDPLLDEDLFQGPHMEPVPEVPPLELEFLPEYLDQRFGVVLQDLGDGHELGPLVLDDDEIHGNRGFALGERVE